jgi:hypothetical protein
MSGPTTSPTLTERGLGSHLLANHDLKVVRLLELDILSVNGQLYNYTVTIPE